MADRIKLSNPHKFDVGIKTQDKPMGMNIKAGSFVLVSEDDVNYIATISTLLQRGVLRIENSAEAKEDVASDIQTALGIHESDPHFADDEDIRKHLSATPKKIEEWLGTVTEPFMLDRIYDIAMSMDLTSLRMAKLKEKMPDRFFLAD